MISNPRGVEWRIAVADRLLQVGEPDAERALELVEPRPGEPFNERQSLAIDRAISMLEG